MKNKERELKREKEYFDKMKSFILEDIKDGRDSHSLAGSIARPVELLHKYMKLWEVKDLYGEPEN